MPGSLRGYPRRRGIDSPFGKSPNGSPQCPFVVRSGRARIVRQVKDAIRAETALTASAGVAPSKFVAKIASDVSKPDGLLVVPADGVRAFLAPLPVRHVWGVGRVTEAALLRLGLRTIGELAAAHPEVLARQFRGGARELVALARGLDDRPVRPDRAPKSIGEEETFARDLVPAAGAPYLIGQAENVARRPLARGLRAPTGGLKLKLAARSHGGRFPSLTRRHTLAEPTADESVLFAVARELLAHLEIGSRRVRLAGLAAANLVAAAPEQLALFAGARDSAARRAAAARAVDELTRRFGAGVVRGRLP